ncbi:MAG: DnaJ domain-containing protein [Pseudomonadota bacterium]
MLKFAVILVLICIVWRWALGQWPWDALKPPPTRAQAIIKARDVLRVAPDASREDILTAHKKLVAKVHPDRGGNSAAVHEANDARDLLLDQLPDESSKGGSVKDEDAGKAP